jgi:hypothetical protein
MARYKRLAAFVALIALPVALQVPPVGAAASHGWTFVGSNQVASSPMSGGGYPVPAGSRVPDAGTCGPGPFNANHSESWMAVKPGTEDVVGSSKFFFDKYSTFYMFYLGAYQIPNGTPSGNNQIQGYDCVSTGTQDMPPSWTDTTDPNLDFDTQGRVYQTMLPFNAFWDSSSLHPDGEIDVSFSDDMGKTWTKGNGGVPLEPPNNASARQAGHVEDKQWIAVNHIPGNANQDHVYAAWAVFNSLGTKVRLAVSRDRGVTFDKAVTISPPSQVGPADTFALPEIDAAGVLYLSIVSFPPNGGPTTIFVARSTDDAKTFSPFVAVATPTIIPTPGLPNTRFRDGITESFAASPTQAGHLYLAYEDWDSTVGQMDVKFTQSTNGGLNWTTPVVVNDNVDAAGAPTDQFQPEVAAGPGGAVAVEFYDRRQACPTSDQHDPSILPADAGRTNFCINTSLQAYKDSGAGAVPVGGNLRVSQFTWDPEQPGQHLGGLSQYPCAGARDPCPTGRGFIGDYFALAVSGQNIYSLSVSTHYPSGVTADEGGPIFYQQQVLSTVPRSAIATGF